jgi:transketolase
VLSPGHGSALIYSLLHLYGYGLELDDLKNFRQMDSKTPGHPEFGHTAGVEATTGPLGQGSANVVGMAIAERHLAQRFNKEGHSIVDHFTFGLVSDGDLMEGISAEAASLAGHLGLGKLICLYDSNDITLDGPAELSYSENVAKRYESYGWHVQTVKHGDTDLEALDAAIQAGKDEAGKPSLIIVKTTIGYGSPNKAGKASSHGSPLGAEETRATKDALGWQAEGEFQVPTEALENCANSIERSQQAMEAWCERFAAWSKAYPELAGEWEAAWNGQLPADWEADLPKFEVGAKLASRAAGGKALNALAARIPWLIGGDADLSCSTKTGLDGLGDFDGASGAGRNIRYGVREHAMGAIANGIAYHGGLRTFTGTFFVFSDYMRPAMRMAAMNGLPVTFVFTHDSVAVGEDGPTHQPVEHLMSLRLMPDLLVVRPCDGPETVAAWKLAMLETERPTTLVLSRQGLPTLDREVMGSAEGLARGAYVLSDPAAGEPQAIIIGTGAEVHQALEAQAQLALDGILVRVVSMPSWELFDEQDAEYQESVLPESIVPRVSIEAGTSIGWERYIGRRGIAIGIDRFGASAPGDQVLSKFGFNADNVAERVRSLLG